MFHGNDERVDQESLALSTELWLAIAEEFVGPQLGPDGLLEALLAQVLLERLGEVVTARDLVRIDVGVVVPSASSDCSSSART